VALSSPDFDKLRKLPIHRQDMDDWSDMKLHTAAQHTIEEEEANLREAFSRGDINDIHSATEALLWTMIRLKGRLQISTAKKTRRKYVKALQRIADLREEAKAMRLLIANGKWEKL
jgi:hypothetical protein